MSRNQLTRLALTLLLIGFAIPVHAQLREPVRSQDAFTHDDQNRRFRTSFPRHDRLSFGLTTFPGQDIGAVQLSFEPKVELQVDFADEEIWWRLRHRFLYTALTTGTPDGTSNLEIELVRARYLRHDVGSYILIPLGQNDIKLPAPFDIAVDYRLLNLQLRTGANDSEVSLREINIIEFSPMADWIRDNAWRHRLAIGPLARYRITRPDLDTADHQFVPFTGGRVVYGYETKRGLLALRFQADVFNETRAIIDEDLRRAWVVETVGNIEWIPFAINNQPVSITGKATVQWEDGNVETRFDLGGRLSFSFF